MYIESGTANGDKNFIHTTSGTINLNTTDLTFSQFSIGGVTSITGTGGIAGSGVSGDITLQLSDNIVKSSFSKIGTAIDQDISHFQLRMR